MKKWIVVSSLMLCSAIGLAAQDVVSAVDGTVKKIDAGTKVVVVKTDDGTVHIFHYMDDLAVHTGEGAKAGSTDTFHGLKQGSLIAVHYSAEGGTETAHEIDNVGKDGLKVTKGTISHIDRTGRNISIKTVGGTEETFRLTGHAADDAGKGVVDGTRASVYYTEDAGEKTAHFIKQAF